VKLQSGAGKWASSKSKNRSKTVIVVRLLMLSVLNALSLVEEPALSSPVPQHL